MAVTHHAAICHEALHCHGKMRLCGTDFVQVFLFPKFSWRIWHIISLLTCSLYSNFRVILLSVATSLWTFVTVFWFWAVDNLPLLGSSSRPSCLFQSFKPFDDMGMEYSFISINSVKHFICFHGCFTEFETNLMLAIAVLWQQRSQLTQSAAADGMTKLELSVYKSLAIITWSNTNWL